MSKRYLTRFTLRALVLAPLAVACSTPPTQQCTGPWLRPSPSLKVRIDSYSRRLPWTHGLERADLIHDFAKVGEPAYPALLELCQDPRVDVAGAALAALGATGDTRLVEALHALPWPSEERFDLRLERARTLLGLGDQSMVPHMIGGLGHERLLIRSFCAKALHDATGKRLGYEAGESAAARAESIERWSAWWRVRSEPVVELARAELGA